MMLCRAILVPNCFCSVSNCLITDAVIFTVWTGVVDADGVLVAEVDEGLHRLCRARLVEDDP